MGVKPSGEARQLLSRQAEGLAKVLGGADENGEVRPEMAVHPFDQRLSQATGEVEVDVRQAGHVVGEEALQGQVPPQRVDVADADEVAVQQGHRRAATAARRVLFPAFPGASGLVPA